MALFIYGTLKDPVMMRRIAGEAPVGRAASLAGHSVLRQLESPLPYLTRSEGQITSGLLFDDLTEGQLQRLDLYETPFGYARKAVDVLVDGREVPAFAYYPAADVKASDDLWNYAEWDHALGDLSREMAQEIGGYDLPLTAHSLARQWPMIAKRATARLIAKSQGIPATRRYKATPGDTKIVTQAPLHGEFFKAGAVEMQHRTFSGGVSDVLPREFFLGTDACMVLPYDPKTDHVLLVEQVRMGPLMRGDLNPWMLEPIAGMIDGGETPEQAALREAKEEADLDHVTLMPMLRFYGCPGNTTDYYHCYLGLCDLAEATTYTGGLDEEAEDLRLHVLPFEEAMALLDSGEIAVGPLVAMLLWLARKRDGLRGSS